MKKLYSESLFALGSITLLPIALRGMIYISGAHWSQDWATAVVIVTCIVTAVLLITRAETGGKERQVTERPPPPKPHQNPHCRTVTPNAGPK